jgi:hypothetical protein
LHFMSVPAPRLFLQPSKFPPPSAPSPFSYLLSPLKSHGIFFAGFCPFIFLGTN